MDFPFWDACFRLEQPEKGDKKTSKKSYFLGKIFESRFLRPPRGGNPGRSGAQLAFIIAFSDRRAVRAQNVVGGHGTELEIRQRERDNGGFRGEAQRRGISSIMRP
ncbi:hypothetical protein [Agrobacterium tumefaciens]|uniref:hypothetical protein n=1 Tax=Agrobacterium tumefaciens TaxID=358 RepID=UPI00273803F4|nr:hypothetical protein [Agrobacterium sp. NCPPB 925]